MTRILSRRTFLDTLATAGAAGIAFSPFLRASRARAQGVFAKRFFAQYQPNGVKGDTWFPKGGETDFVLSPSLTSLQPYRNDIIVFKGLMVKTGKYSSHEAGTIAFLTGREMAPGNFSSGSGMGLGWASGPSIDQVLATQLKIEGPLRTLELGVRTRGQTNWSAISYRAMNQPIMPQNDPYFTFDRVFGGISKPSIDGTLPGANELNAIRLRKKSVLDFVSKDLSRIKNIVGSEEQYKLESHLDAIRAIEQSLNQMATNPTTQCSPLNVGNKVDHLNSLNFPAIGKLQMDIILAAWACGLNRIATLMWSNSVSEQKFSWLGHTESHHHMSHSNEQYRKQIVEIDTWYAQQFAYMIRRLKEMPEGNGTMLDNSILLWGNELNEGGYHGHSDVPYVLAGRAGGYFRTGRFLQLNNKTNHNDVLTSICHGMGVPLPKFGLEGWSTGPLATLKA